MGKKRRQFFNDADEQNFRWMLDVCKRDFPAQTFIGVDSELKPCIFVSFINHGKPNSDWWHFSTMKVAIKAFVRLERILDEQLKAEMRKYNLPADMPF